MQKKPTFTPNLIDSAMGKLPPQVPEIENGIVATCLSFGFACQLIPFLKPEHFYSDKNQIIFQAIIEIDNPSLLSVTHKLKSNGTLESVGGAHYLVKLSDGFINVANLEYHARIVQQMWIKRELIRISGIMIKDSYDTSTDCIELFDRFTSEIESIESLFDPETARHKIISGKENEMMDLEIARQGQKITGLSTGYSKLDEHFRFKPSSFVIINGHDNVGKTFAVIHLAVCSNVLHGWKWILACLENAESRVRQDIIQARTGKHISRLTQEEFMMWYDWSVENFKILKIDSQMTAERMMKTANRIIQDHPSQGFFIDPYNALMLPKSKDKFFNSHEYHYEVTGAMRNFIKKTGCSIYLSTHAVTEALRAKHKDGDFAGHPMPPQKADVEGGGKFANRADDFLTFHRYTNHPTENLVTHIHVRKIKDTQTGGRPTIADDPVKLKTIKGYFGLFDENGNSPLVNTQLPKITTTPKHSQDDQPF